MNIALYMSSFLFPVNVFLFFSGNCFIGAFWQNKSRSACSTGVGALSAFFFLDIFMRTEGFPIVSEKPGASSDAVSDASESRFAQHKEAITPNVNAHRFA